MDERYLQDQWSSGAIRRVLAIVRRTIPKMGLDRPKIGRPDFTYKRGAPCERCGPDDWVDGFWPGQLWLGFALTADDIFRDAAKAYRPYFRERLDQKQGYSHDFGFLYSLSMVAEYQLTGAEEAKAIALRAAEILAARYKPARPLHSGLGRDRRDHKFALSEPWQGDHRLHGEPLLALLGGGSYWA